MKNRWPWILYAILCLFSIGVVICAFFIQVMAGVGIYDNNFETFHNVLTNDQGTAIIRAARAYLAIIVALLTLTNLLWMIGFGCAIWRWKKKNG